MALTNHIGLRANYLQTATYLLAVSSPAAAAIIGSARDRYIEDAGLVLPTKELETLRRGICGACGSPLLPGWSCKVVNRPQVVSNRKKGQGQGHVHETTKSDKSTIYTCLRCHRETTHMVQQRPARSVRKSKAHTDGLDKLPVRENDHKISKTANASSKQRQKARKGGLQAMLEKNKASISNSTGFDLMDFAM